MKKFIFVTGGVVSGLGKGITAASLGRLLKQRGLNVAAQKLDPYMNVDPGTMSPYEHGEVFVTDDGAETDLDIGHYERFIDENLTKHSNLTSGKVYWNVLSRERQGKYLGQTVQVIPHITGEIKDFIYASANETGADILITEIGGTTGDIESQPFLEAIRQVSLEVSAKDCLFIHVALVPYLKGSNEHKSKPVQHSVKELRSLGISPNIIIARADEKMNDEIFGKIALFCNVKHDCVIENITLPNLYEAPIMLNENGLDEVVCRELGITTPRPNLTEWKTLVDKIRNRTEEVTIAVVGKYIRLQDAYLSIVESLNHAGYNTSTKINIKWIDSETITNSNIEDVLSSCNGVLVPGGFGDRGIEGKVLACKYARENDIPYFGICLGMQIAAIEFARSVCKLEEANSAEFDNETQHKIIDIMEEQVNITQKGGTMRLGAYPCAVKEDTLLHDLYKENLISERHRHRFEFNNSYRKIFTENGIIFSGTSPDDSLVEAIEYPENEFFIGVQFHPEFKSRPNKPHAIFEGFVRASLRNKNK